MIVDTSVLIAILRSESDAADLLQTIERASSISMSAGSWVELGVVLSHFGRPEVDAQSHALAESIGLKVEPVTVEQAETARRAYREYGKGNHPARLNFGDCFAYALSKAAGEPLLFKGEDFARTDVQRA